MAKNAGTITIGVEFTISLWDAIKWRIAGPELREVMVENLRKRQQDDEGEEWKRG